MKIAICGSMSNKDQMLHCQKQLHDLGYETHTPDFGESGGEIAKSKQTYINQHIAKMSECDAILVVNITKNGVDNYIGGNTFMEISFAYMQGLEIFLLNPVPAVSYSHEIEALQPIILNGEMTNLDNYFTNLPKTYLSSKSPVKLAAVSRGLRRAGIRTTVLPLPAQSNVAEQPLSIEETYEGAVNRHDTLVTNAPKDAAYLATVESGNHYAHKDHNYFGCDVVIIDKVGSERKIGIDLDIEFPKTMTDKIPSVYPDLGVLVQQEYGSKVKDPYPFFTGGRITRQQLV